MTTIRSTCIKCGASDNTIKNGKTKNGKQRFKCKVCNKRFITNYTYVAYNSGTNSKIKSFVKEGLGIRSISRVIGISATTVMARIVKIARKLQKPIILKGKEYQLDEMCTFIGYKKKQTWIAYAMRKDTKQVIDFSIGRRTNKTLRKVIETLVLSEPKRIHTDKLRNYTFLIPKNIHSNKRRGTNHIERKNLSLRTHLKRLNRRTICFSRSSVMLSSCLKIYFWG